MFIGLNSPAFIQVILSLLSEVLPNTPIYKAENSAIIFLNICIIKVIKIEYTF